MTTITTSEKTGSYASTIASLYKKKIPGLKIVPNRKLYHKEYAHVIELNDRPYSGFFNSRNYLEIRASFETQADKLKANKKLALKTRVEGYTLRLYTNDVESVLNALPAKMRRMVTLIQLMEPEVLKHIVTTPKETYRTIDRVVKKLPHGNQRFKVYYANRYNVKEAIGSESLEGILFHLKQYPSLRWTDDLEAQITSVRGNWNETFFYCTDLDWLPMVTLIDSRFIKRIERLTVETEIVTS